MNKSTYSAKPSQIKRTWYIIDAASTPLGRVATIAASYLIGKHKPTYTSHIDVGDGIIIINAKKTILTGNKLTQKIYYRHSGYPGNLKSRTALEQMERDPTWVLRQAVKGMLPRNKLQTPRLLRLKIYSGAEHPHEPQQPKELKVESRKVKSERGLISPSSKLQTPKSKKDEYGESD